jgi:anti-sigma factor RsiW
VTDGTAELSCQELVELVTDYLDGALPDAERARFEDHLAICEGCRTYLDQMQTTIRVVGRLTADDLDPRAEAALLEAFRAWKSA